MNPIPFSLPWISRGFRKKLEMWLQGNEAPDAVNIVEGTQQALAAHLGTPDIMLTSSCTHALEISAMLCDIQAGDEIIMPSFTYPSTANAFVLRGGIPVFTDIRSDTQNIDENLIERAITKQTRAIVAVHYAGVSAEMNRIREIAAQHQLMVIEDAAHAIFSRYHGELAGSMGDAACLSFDQSKNIHCYKGGALITRNDEWREKACIILEKGTNRQAFDKGKTSFYTWMDMGSNYGMNVLNAFFLADQLEFSREIQEHRLQLWNTYNTLLKELADQEKISLPFVPDGIIHNGHIFYLLCRDLKTRNELIGFLSTRGITATFHYIPLHLSPAGKRFGRFNGEDQFTGKQSECLLRLPLYHELQIEEAEQICSYLYQFFKGR